MLNIRTVGIREWRKETDDYNRYEATPYVALKKLFKRYKLNKTDRLVDFGSGRGRISFYVHYHFHIPVIGVENNDKTFEEALDNKVSYRHKADDILAPIYFEYGLAEQYEIQHEDNRFFFFNPFSVDIFKKVVKNILKSVEKSKRSVDIILYYPLGSYKHVLKKTPFQLMDKIVVPGIHGRYGKFLIYRLSV